MPSQGLGSRMEIGFSKFNTEVTKSHFKRECKVEWIFYKDVSVTDQDMKTY